MTDIETSVTNKANVDKWLNLAAKYELEALELPLGEERDKKHRSAILAFKKAMTDDGASMSVSDTKEFTNSLEY